MATDADLAGGTGKCRPLLRIGREHQLSLAIEHPDTVDAMLVRDDAHHLVRGFAVVVEHGMPGCAGNAARKLVSAKNHGFDQPVLLHAEIQVSANTADRNDQDSEREDQLEVESAGHLDPHTSSSSPARRDRRDPCRIGLCLTMNLRVTPGAYCDSLGMGL